LPPITTTDPGAVFDALVRERQVEFVSEQIRYRDVRRWLNNGKLATNPIAADVEITSRYDLLPIPQQEIDNNPALTQADQNPGY
jgi:hypothetical protein